MTRSARITLTDHFVRFIDEQVASGRYGSADEVVVEGLRLVEERERRWRMTGDDPAEDAWDESALSEEDARKLAALRAAIEEGERSGDPQPFDFDEFLARKRRAQAGE